jgi:outer membrane protein OmpA-like peptidoglycan-associated protein
MNKRIKIIFIFGALCGIFAFCGCSNPSPQYFEKITQIQKDDYFAAGTAKVLRSQGVSISSKSNSVIAMKIPERLLFTANSANLLNTARPVLNNVVKYANYYEEESMRINSMYFSDPQKSSDNHKNLAISKERARQIEKYLWSQDINVSLIYSNGYLFNSSNSDDLSSDGYITITFQKFYRE